MTVTDFLLPVFVQVGLTFVVLLIMARERVGSLRRGEVRTEDIALREPNWTTRGMQYGNSFLNQIELPMLFYALIAFILITKAGDVLLLFWPGSLFCRASFTHTFTRPIMSSIGASWPTASACWCYSSCG